MLILLTGKKIRLKKRFVHCLSLYLRIFVYFRVSPYFRQEIDNVKFCKTNTWQHSNDSSQWMMGLLGKHERLFERHNQQSQNTNTINRITGLIITNDRSAVWTKTSGLRLIVIFIREELINLRLSAS